MKISSGAVFVIAAAWVMAGCGSSDDDGAVSGVGGQPGADAAEELEEQDSSPEGGGGAAGDDGGEAGNAGDAAPDAPPVGCTQAPRKFWVYDLSVMPPKYVEIASTCRAEGDHAYVYVADDIWGAKMNQADVDQVVTAFESSTPADATKGIFELATGLFGSATDVDDDGHVFLLYMEIKPYQGNQFDGFIRAEDMLGGTKSNGSEVVYLDGVRNDPGGEYMLGVAAHELTHLIAVNHNPNQASWLQEVMSETSMIACGYYGDLTDWVPSFAKNPAQSLTTEQPGVNYGAAFLYGGYLYERFGAGFFKALSDEPQPGIAGIDAVLAAQGKTDTFKSVLPDWAAANFLDAPAVDDGRYGYEGFDLPAMAATSATLPAAASTLSVPAHSARYVIYTVDAPASSTIAIKLQSANSANLAFRYAAFPETDKASATVGAHSMAASDDTLLVSGVGGGVNRVMLAVVEDGGSAASVTVSAAVQ